MTPEESAAAAQQLSEVCEGDAYGLRGLTRLPLAHIYDIGACLGIFSLWSRVLFPKAEVTSIEPDAGNFCCLLKLLSDIPGVHLVNGALGSGAVVAHRHVLPGHRIYTTLPSLAGRQPTFEATATPSVTLGSLLSLRPPQGEYLVKLDCEGAEYTILDDQPSREALAGAAAIVAEVHPVFRWFDRTEEERAALRAVQQEFVASLRRTHVAVIERVSEQEMGLYQFVRKGMESRL